jgi:hypothetical protein
MTHRSNDELLKPVGQLVLKALTEKSVVATSPASSSPAIPAMKTDET